MPVPSVAGLCHRRQYGRLVTLFALSLAAGCSAGSDAITIDTGGPSTGAAVYIGSFASATESGTVTLSLAATSTGTMVQVNGTTTALTGTYSASSGAVSLSGGGFTYTGILVSGTLTGTFRSAKSFGARSRRPPPPLRPRHSVVATSATPTTGGSTSWLHQPEPLRDLLFPAAGA